MTLMADKQQRFLSLFEPLQPHLQRFVLAMTRNEELTKDIIGETILIAFERIDALRHDEAFLSFLFTIATRIYRKRSREMERTVGIEPEDVAGLFDHATPPDVAADIAALYVALEKLPQKQREAVLLYEVIGLSTQEIRDVQGGTLVGVRVRIARARKKLARILGVDDIITGPAATDHRKQYDDSAPVDDIHIYSVRINHE